MSERNDERVSLFNIIRNIAREEFKIEESNIKELINSNVNKTTDHLDKLSSDVEIDRCHRIGPHKTKTGQNRD